MQVTTLLFLSGVALASADSFSAEDQAIWIDRHNYFRSTGLPWSAGNMRRIGWDADLATTAASTASRCSASTAAGLNVYQSSSSNSSDILDEAIQQWVVETSMSTLASLTQPSASGQEVGTGTYNSYSQVLWATTTSVGCATASCSGGEMVVCQYSPAGNDGSSGWYIHADTASDCPSGTTASQGLCIVEGDSANEQIAAIPAGELTYEVYPAYVADMQTELIEAARAIANGSATTSSTSTITTKPTSTTAAPSTTTATPTATTATPTSTSSKTSSSQDSTSDSTSNTTSSKKTTTASKDSNSSTGTKKSTTTSTDSDSSTKQSSETTSSSSDDSAPGTVKASSDSDSTFTNQVTSSSSESTSSSSESTTSSSESTTSQTSTTSTTANAPSTGSTTTESTSQTPPPTTSSDSRAISANNQSGTSSNGGISAAGVAGMIVLAVVLIAAVGVVMSYRKNQRRQREIMRDGGIRII